MSVATRRGARLALLSLALAVPAAPAGAATFADALEIFEGSGGEPAPMSFNEAASRAQDRYGGQVLSVKPASRDGRRGWRVKVLVDGGRVKTLFVDERTGAVRDRQERR